MDKQPLISKWLAIVIVLVFVGTCIIPSNGIPIRYDDTTPPVTIISFNPPEPDGENGWYVSNVTATLNSTDNESGVNITYYRVNNGGWEEYENPFFLNTSNVYWIEFYSIDNAGNVENVTSASCDVDVVPPVTHIIINDNGVIIQVSLQATDDMSGVRYTYFQIDGGTWQEGHGFILSSDGSHIINFFSIDYAGNFEEIKQVIINPPQPDKVLYVGGSGPGNYTKIQDAIDNATDGDTIFVFHGIYNETIVVNISISLLGEKKETTIITNDGMTDVVTLNTDCSLQRFTILNEKSDTHTNGITVNSGGNLISDNIIGIVYSRAICLNNAHDNRIENNFIKNTYNIGIYLGDSYRNTIQKNRITEGVDGIHIYFTSSDNLIRSNQIDNTSNGISFWCTTQRNNVSLNHFENNGVAVGFYDYATDNTVFQNYFEKNNVGVVVKWHSELNKIISNTFMKNKISSFYFLYLKNTNVWDCNYWSISRMTPKLVFGLALVPPYLIFDRYPAQEPYDIPGMS